MTLVRIKFSRRRLQVHRDEHGVPHIHAQDWEGALYGLGYMHAVDRRTQMLFSRLVAQGRMAQAIGPRPELLEMDRFFRRVGLFVGLDEEVAALSAADRRLLEAYCQGVNDAMQQAGSTLPMWWVGLDPKPWNPKSVLLIGSLVNYGSLVIGQLREERLLLELIQLGAPEDRLRELFEPLLDQADFRLLGQVKLAARLSDEALALLSDLPRMAGSNAWAVAPQRSKTGHALLAADPHLEVNRLPAIWYEAVLRWGEQEYLMGATLPGTPIVAVGRTRHLAWGVTHYKGDVADYFVEHCRRRKGQWHYRRGKHYRPFQVRQEVIHRKGEEPEVLRVYSNELGVLEGDPDRLGEGYLLLEAWTGRREGSARSMAAWLHLAEQEQCQQAMRLVRTIQQPSLCWVFADRRGEIAMQVNGAFPLRPPGANGVVPLPAWKEENHWQGLVPTRRLVRRRTPKRGYLVAANDPLNPRRGPKLVTLPVHDYRKRRIEQRLAELDQATVEDMQQIQYDVVSLQARELLPVLLPLLPPGPIKEELSAWDGSYTPESRAATLFTLLYGNLVWELAHLRTRRRKRKGITWQQLLYAATQLGYSTSLLTALDRLLHKARTRAWWKDRRELAQALAKAAEAIDPEKIEPWGQYNSFQFVNRFIEGPWMGRALGFHTGQLPMPGCFATPFQGSLTRLGQRETSYAPSYHFVTDLGTDVAWTNLPGGPSESGFSRWYKSGIARWLEGRYKVLNPLDAGQPPQPEQDGRPGAQQSDKPAPESAPAQEDRNEQQPAGQTEPEAAEPKES